MLSGKDAFLFVLEENIKEILENESRMQRGIAED